MRYCPQCDTFKPKTEFYKQRGKKSGYRSYCKECGKKYVSTYKRESHIKKTYGVSEDYIRGMMDAQRGSCALCGEDLLRCGQYHIDHCHQSGRIRGLLCANCNTKLGWVEDVGLEQIKGYLE